MDGDSEVESEDEDDDMDDDEVDSNGARDHTLHLNFSKCEVIANQAFLSLAIDRLTIGLF